MPLPGGFSSRPVALNAPLWAMVSLFTAFSFLWTATLGQMVNPDAMAAPLGAVAGLADRASIAAQMLRRTAAAFPTAQSVVLARLRPGTDWTLVEVDGKTVRVSDPARIEAALTSAGFTLETGDRLVALPNSGRQLVQRAVPFSLVDAGIPFSHRVAADSVGEALRSIGVDVNTADVVQPPQESPLAPGLRVTILRAQPVTITAPDTQLETRSRAATVAELLAEQGVPLGPLDRVDPALNAMVPAYGTVHVVRVREEELRETLVVPFKTSTQYSADLLPGSRYRARTGVAGLVERLFRVVFENDVETQREALVENVLRPALDEVMVVAKPPLPQLPLLPVPSLPIAPLPGSAPGGPDAPVRRVMTMVATAYDAGPISTGKSPGHPAYGITASGMRATFGVVAIDPRVIPFYTRLYIPGYGYAIAGDTGGDIRGNRIDLFYPTYGEAIRWGRRTVTVYILE